MKFSRKKPEADAVPLWDMGHDPKAVPSGARREGAAETQGVPLWDMGQGNSTATPEARQEMEAAAGQAKSAAPLWDMGPAAPVRATRATSEEEGTPLQWLSILGFCLAAGLLGGLFHRFFFRGYGMEALDLAQLGRNLSQGQGFSTDFLRPALLPHLTGGKLVPDLSNAPLYPLLLGSMFAFLGEGDRALPVLPLLLLALSASLLWVLARRLSHSGWVSGLAVAAYLLAQPVLAAVDTAQPAILSTALLLLLLIAMTPYSWQSDAAARDAEPGDVALSTALAPTASKTLRRNLRIGALVGLCYLADYFSLLYVVPLLLLWKRGAAIATDAVIATDATRAAPDNAPRGGEALGILLGALLVVTPWLWRNFVLAGNPFYSTQWLELAMNTRQTPGMSMLREAGGAQAWPGPVAIFIKWVRTLGALFFALPFLPHIYLTPFIATAFFLRFEAERLGRFKWAVLAAFGSLLLGLTLLGRAPAALLPLVPLLCLLGAAAYVHLASGWLRHLEESRASEGVQGSGAGQRLRRFAPALCTLVPLALFALPLAGQMVQSNAPTTNEAGVRAYFEPIASAVKAGDNRAIASDMPWLIAWYAGRRAVWLPNQLSQLARIEAKQPLSAIYLSPGIANPAGELIGREQWLPLYQGTQNINGFDRNPRDQQRDVLLVRRPSLGELALTARKEPKNPEAQLRLGESQLNSGRYREALVSFGRLKTLRPNVPHGYLGEGKALFGLKSYQPALAAFSRAIALSGQAVPMRIEAQLQSADILNGRGDAKGAAAFYEAVLADEPNQPVALNNLAFIYASGNQNLNRALEMARRAAAADPQNGLIRDTLGWVCFRLKRFPEAQEQLREAARLSPGEKGVQLHLRQALAATGQI